MGFFVILELSLQLDVIGHQLRDGVLFFGKRGVLGIDQGFEFLLVVSVTRYQLLNPLPNLTLFR